jgi:hypothetical protein
MTKAQKKFGGVADTFDQQNLAVARLILRQAAPGDDGLAVEWARAVLKRHGLTLGCGKQERERPGGER